jgi:hypothetical protein
LRGDDRVRLPCVAELARSVLGVAPWHPVHLVRPDPGLVLAVEEPQVPLAEELQPALGHEALLDDQEPVSPKGLDLLGGERVDQERGLVFSGS